jgi:hypothetical protein
MNMVLPRQIYAVSRPELPWGDYGRILAHGMSAHLPRKDGRIQLERAGPFAPAITFPAGDILVTEGLKRDLEAAAFTGLQFAPVDLARAVRLDWHLWDQSVADPAEYPADGEPESYLLLRPHDPAAAEAIGAVWECMPETWGTASGEIVSRRPLKRRITLSSEGTEPDFFRPRGTRYLLASQRATQWLAKAVGRWVSVDPVDVVE